MRRRDLLAAGAFLPLSLWAAPTASAAPRAPDIQPREAWAQGLAPTRALEPERDVRFLLVHHTQTPADAPEAITRRLRSIYAFHTGRERGWADVAYNFFVDPYGTIWEGRAGSIAGPVRGDATGGSQGFAELVCFVGDFTHEAPTNRALEAMTSLLTWLANRDGLAMNETVSFVSRGSNRWPAGATVTTAPIAGHRDMSLTACPGDALYPLVATRLLPDVQRRLAGPPATPEGPPADSASPQPSPASTPEPSTPTQASPDADLPLRGIGMAMTIAGALGVALAQRIGGASAEENEGQDDTANDDGRKQADHKRA